ncbi:NAD(P)/FAD-dependent oxidoreductase [Chlamydiifrater phoenicopteri]|uniref:NAD(P)/FAD-dependent oxidoreductase n=1 Tax=Chlamydiifrater phoenicopteri TaxID=2681469 RepID=UPI001BCE877E|nr:FAD-dependent oxidoreductase [Chlamydiifrater phoenicopteri]
MHIAILGAGYAGLSLAWHLLLHSQGTAAIDLFDPVPIGEGTSGMSSGLLHAFTGRKALKPYRASDALVSAHYLITETSKVLGHSVVLSSGIVRPASDEEQLTLFQKRVEEFPQELEWWEKSRCELEIPGIVIPDDGGALFIKDGITINNEEYMQGLWMACSNLGTQFYDEIIENISDIEDFYDHIVIAPGANWDVLPETKDIPLNKVKGQLLKVELPKSFQTPKYSINAHKYMVSHATDGTYMLGATFEHNLADDEPNQEVAYNEIFPALLPLFPQLKEAQIIDCFSGVRVSSPTRKPVTAQIKDKVWFVGGFGSKGLLYHGLVGDMLAKAVLAKSTAYIDKEFLFSAST